MGYLVGDRVEAAKALEYADKIISKGNLGLVTRILASYRCEVKFDGDNKGRWVSNSDIKKVP